MNKKDFNGYVVKSVVKGGLWLYIDMILINLVGYVYWMIIGSIGGSSVIGYASVTISFSGIIQSIILLGIPIGLQRFVGKSFSDNNYAKMKEYFISSITFILILSIITVSILWFFSYLLEINIGLQKPYIILAAFLVMITGINAVFRNFLVSILHIDKILIIDATANIIRLVAGVYLVIIGLKGIGAVAGYVFSGLATLIFFAFHVFKLFQEANIIHLTISIKALRDVLKAGFASWLPQVVTKLGIQLGILILFGWQGPSVTGIYYLTFTIFGVLLALPTMILGLLFPILSGLKEGHVYATHRAINIVLAISIPLSVILAVYSKFVMNIIGSEFADGWIILFILTFSIPLACIINGVNSLVYALGKYKTVLIIGSAMSFVRILAYILIVPLLGSVGTAYAFDMGFIPAFVLAIYYAKKNNLFIDWKLFIIAAIVPYSIGFAVWMLNVPWYIGPFIILFFSEVIFVRIKLFSKEDIRDVSFALIPSNIIKKISPRIYPLLKILFGD